MKINVTKRRLVLSIAVMLIGIMTMLTLCIPVLSINKLNVKETGFSLLDFTSDDMGLDEWFANVTGIFSLFILLLSVFTIFFAGLSIFFFKDKTAKKLLNGLSVSCLALIFVYMLWIVINQASDFTYLHAYKAYNDRGWDYKYISYQISSIETIFLYKTSTLVHLGLALEAFLFAAYMVFSIVLKQTNTDFADVEGANTAIDEATAETNADEE